jgi:hypothetical protein
VPAIRDLILYEAKRLLLRCNARKYVAVAHFTEQIGREVLTFVFRKTRTEYRFHKSFVSPDVLRDACHRLLLPNPFNVMMHYYPIGRSLNS